MRQRVGTGTFVARPRSSIVEDLDAYGGTARGKPGPIVSPMTTQPKAKIDAAGSASLYASYILNMYLLSKQQFGSGVAGGMPRFLFQCG